MKNLISRIHLFYKLADAQQISQKHYDEFVSRIQLKRLYEVIGFIVDYYQAPFFNLQDILAPNYNWLFGSPEDLYKTLKEESTQITGHPLPHNLIKDIMNYKAKMHMEDINVGDFLQIEKVKDIIDPAIMNEAKRRIILKFIRDWTAIPKKIEEVARKSQTQEEADRKSRGIERLKKKSVVDAWIELYNNSTTLPKQFLEEFAKKLGIDFYGRLWARSKDVDDIDKQYEIKKAVNIWDMAKYLNSKINFTSEELQSVFSKADEEAKEYARGFLYQPVNPFGPYIPGSEFMLDAEMQPMNYSYKKMRWPDMVSLMEVSGSTEKIRWMKIFNEFGVIPQ